MNAFELSRQGWKVFPAHTVTNDGTCSCGKSNCERVGKHPRISRWNVRATCDEKQILKWVTKWPDGNWAIATGKDSNIVVLDVDGEEGEKSLKELETKYGPLPTTRVVTTHRGRHLYFQHPGPTVKTTDSVIGKCIDVKADGGNGCVNAVGSRHKSGMYEWVDRSIGIARLPERWIEALTTEDDNPTAEELIHKGQRDHRIYEAICSFFREGFTEPDVLRKALAMNAKLCVPPLPETEIHEKVSRVAATHNPQFVAEIFSKTNPLRWFQFDAVAFKANMRIQALKDYELGQRTQLLALAWQNGGRLLNDYDYLAREANASNRKRFKQDVLKVLFDFEPVSDRGQSYLINREMVAEYAEKLKGWKQKREAGIARAKERAKEREHAQVSEERAA